MTKYMVVSRDSEEQQVFFDLIEAEDEEKANEVVSRARDYANVVDVLTLEDIEQMAERMRGADNFARTPIDLLKVLGEIDEHGCADCRDCGKPSKLVAWVDEIGAVCAECQPEPIAV